MNPLDDKTATPLIRIISLVIMGLLLLGILTYDVTTYSKKNSTTYQTINKNTNSLELGKSKIKQKGKPGVETTYYEKRAIFGITLSNSEVNSETTKRARDAIVLVGTREKVVQAPEPLYTPPPTPSCDSNYSGGCVPIVGYDLNCPDISFTVYVVGVDNHGFDGDGDGVGCEWN